MSVTIRPYVTGGWEVDIHVRLPDGSMVRERTKSSLASKSATARWASERERHLALHGKPKPARVIAEEEDAAQRVCTLREFTRRFLDGYAKANRLKPSGVASKSTVFRKHLLPRFADTKLDQITTEDVQQLKASLGSRSPKTVNNILTVLSVTLKTAVEWGVIARMPCTIKLLRVSKGAASFHSLEEYGRLVDAAKHDPLAYLVVLLGGDGGLRCGEIMALEWKDVDLQKRQLCVARSDWKGHVTATKGGRVRYVPMTVRLAEALKQGRHLRGIRVATGSKGEPLTQKVVQGLLRRAACRARVKEGVHILRHTFCSHLAMRGAPARAIQELAGHQDLATTQRYMHLSPAALDEAIRLLDGPGVLERGGLTEAAGK